MKSKYVTSFLLLCNIMLISALSFAAERDIKEGVSTNIIISENTGTLLYAAQPGSKEQTPGKSEEPASPKEESIFHISTDVTFASKYIWQGLDYSDGKPVIQPEVSFGYKELSATVWFNYNIDKKVLDEMDLYLQYSKSLEALNITGGYAHFNYPHRDGWKPSEEVFATMSYSALIKPSLEIHYDFGAGKGTYYNLGLSHDHETKLGVISLASVLHYHNNYYNMSGCPSLEFHLNDAYTTGSLTITPSISYFLTWNNVDYKDVGNNTVFSINTAWNF